MFRDSDEMPSVSWLAQCWGGPWDGHTFEVDAERAPKCIQVERPTRQPRVPGTSFYPPGSVATMTQKGVYVQRWKGSRLFYVWEPVLRAFAGG